MRAVTEERTSCDFYFLFLRNMMHACMEMKGTTHILHDFQVKFAHCHIKFALCQIHTLSYQIYIVSNQIGVECRWSQAELGRSQLVTYSFEK